MKKNRQSTFLLLVSLLIVLSGLLYACSDEALEEPAVYTPAEIRRLLLGDGTKLWRQTSEYYLEDSCRTGYILRFRENLKKNKSTPFLADYYRDTTACAAGDTLYLNWLAIAKKNPEFTTTDTLLFINVPADTAVQADTSFQLIRHLTSQQLVLEVPQEGGESLRLEYSVVPEEEEEE